MICSRFIELSLIQKKALFAAIYILVVKAIINLAW
jgi:hypothetical protein